MHAVLAASREPCTGSTISCEVSLSSLTPLVEDEHRAELRTVLQLGTSLGSVLYRDLFSILPPKTLPTLPNDFSSALAMCSLAGSGLCLCNNASLYVLSKFCQGFGVSYMLKGFCGKGGSDTRAISRG